MCLARILYRVSYVTAVVFVAAALVDSTARASSHDTVNPGVYDLGTMPFGQTHAQWGQQWWNWGVREGADTNVLIDETGEFGHLNQDGPVWFLGGNFGGVTERTLAVPADKALFFPIMTAAWWAPDDLTIDPSSTHAEQEADLRAQANGSMDAVSVLEVTIDGVALQNLTSYRAESPSGGFVLEVPEGSLLHSGGVGGEDRDPTVADGFWIMLDPLDYTQVKQHVIRFHGIVGDASAPDFELDVTYNIVPETSSMLLMMMGATGLLGGGRHRRRRE